MATADYLYATIYTVPKRTRQKSKNSQPHIIALGGSVVAPDGIDLDFISKFGLFIKQAVRKGHRFLLVIGGGALAREYQRAAKSLAHETPQIELDTIGMRATRVNADLLRVALGKNVHPEIVENPERLLHIRDPIAIAAGFMPGYSTDTVAVRIAEEINAPRVIIAGRPAYVYDRDFMRYPNAKPIRSLTWAAYKKLIGKRWRPGMSAPVDPIAAQRASKFGIEVIVVRGNDLLNFGNVISHKPFKGTRITQ